MILRGEHNSESSREQGRAGYIGRIGARRGQERGKSLSEAGQRKGEWRQKRMEAENNGLVAFLDSETKAGSGEPNVHVPG